jgi:hypothetical protein
LKDIVLTKDQYEHRPYKTTEKKKDDTIGDIVVLLRKHGVKKYIMDEENEAISFLLTVKHLDMERIFPIKITIPHMMYYLPTRRGSKNTTLTYLEKESWRVAWWYLKVKLDSITYGISDSFQEFMPNIYHSLPDGREVMLSDIILKAKKLTEFESLEDNSTPQEPGKRAQVDVDYTVIGDDK